MADLRHVHSVLASSLSMAIALSSASASSGEESFLRSVTRPSCPWVGMTCFVGRFLEPTVLNACQKE